MDRTAGFAASIALRQEMMQSLVRVLYNAGQFPHSITFGVPELQVSFFLSMPALTFQSPNGNQVAIDLYGWGPMTVTPPGSLPESRRVKFRAHVLVPLTVTISGQKLVFGFDGPAATVSGVQFDPYSGGLFSPAAVSYLTSAGFHALLTQGLQLTLAQLSVLPPLRIDFLGAIASDPTAAVVSRVLDGVLALGIDVDTPAGRTHGNPALLTDTTNGSHIGMWTSPRVIPQAFPDVQQKVEEAVQAQSATLNSFTLAVQEGWFRVAGRASKTGGSVNFSLHAVPRLIRPGTHFEFDDEYGEHFDLSTPDREELWFDPQDIDVDIDRDWWVIALEGIGGLLTLGIGALIIEGLVGTVQGEITTGIAQNDQSRGARNQEFTLSGVTRPSVQLRIETFECHQEGVHAGITIKPQFWWATIDGPRFIPAEEALTGESFRFVIGLPPDVLPDDPELRVSWTLRRTDTNEILGNRDAQAGQNLSFAFGISTVPFLEISRLGIEWRVYRTLGAGTDEIYRGQQYIDITDYVDRSHPFVQWDHQVNKPVVRVEPNGSRTVLGREIVLRHSAIHRTALPGRCRMLRRYSLTRLFPPEPREYPLVYTDDLPFPHSEIIANRALLCDYCFFGGPDKNVPLV